VSSPDPNQRVSPTTGVPSPLPVPLSPCHRFSGSPFPRVSMSPHLLVSVSPCPGLARCRMSPRLAETLESQNWEERCPQPTPIPSQGSAFVFPGISRCRRSQTVQPGMTGLLRSPGSPGTGPPASGSGNPDVVGNTPDRRWHL